MTASKNVQHELMNGIFAFKTKTKNDKLTTSEKKTP
jgi:hypothetical protein